MKLFAILAALLLSVPAFAQTGITDLIVARKVTLQGITAPAALTGPTNDYAPAQFLNATTFKLSSTLNVSISGLAGGTPGRIVWLVNAGSFDLTFLAESSLSLAQNRFALVGPTVLLPGMAMSYIYDGVASRWMPLSQGKASVVWGQIGGTLADQTDLNNQDANLARAALTTGIISEADTVLFSAPNTSTLRIAPVTAGVYSLLLGPGLPVATAIKSFPQQDYPLANLGLIADGTYARWIGYDSSGTVVTSTARFTNDASVIGLGVVVVKRVAGVTTFIDDGGPRSFLTSPQMAGFSELERATVGGFKSTVTVSAASTNMTLSRAAGSITGISVNWEAVSGNKNVLDLASSSPASFIEVNPLIASSTSLPAPVTVLTATNYWNGSASVLMTGPNYASVKRFLIGVKGGFFVQEGEAQYTTLDIAVANAGVAPFTNLLAQELLTEIGRVAVVRTATNLSDPNQARFFVTGAGTGSGSGGVTTTITGTANQVLANATSGTPQAGAVILTLPQNIATTSSPTFAGLTLTHASAPVLNYAYAGGNVATTGALEFPSVTTAAATLQVFRTTNTSGAKSVVFYKGDNTASPVFQFNSVNGQADFYGGGNSLVLGADSGLTTRTDATAKILRIGAPHYTNAAAPAGGIVVSTAASTNTVYIGGGTSNFNAATTINLLTAANNTTPTGTIALAINSAQQVSIPTVTDATSTTTGALIVSGGLGLAKNLFMGGQLSQSWSPGAFAAGTVRGAQYLSNAAGDAGGTTNLRAIEAQASAIGANNFAATTAVLASNTTTGSAGTVTQANSIWAFGSIGGTGQSIGTYNAFLVSGSNSGSGNINTAWNGLNITGWGYSGAGNLNGTGTAILINDVGRATATTVSGIYINDQTKGSGNAYGVRIGMTLATGKYSLFSDGPAASYHAGEFWLGANSDAGAYILQVTGDAIFSGTLTRPGLAVPVITTSAAITSGAGAGAGTLTNAPAAGNPTKWIPINDAGVTRYLPAW